MRNRNVLLLQVFLKYDEEFCGRELAAIKRATMAPFKPSMHDKRHLALVITTPETPSELVDRLRPVLDVDAVSNYWALIPCRPVAAKYGGLDSLPTRIGMAYATILNRGPSKNFSKREILVKKRFRKDASGEMRVKRGGDRKSPK